MGTYIDHSNTQHARLFALYRIPNQGMHTMWQCICDCGNLVEVRAQHLRNGNSKSCGCLDAETRIARSTKHGQCGSKAYVTWGAMLQRCSNPNNKCKHIYLDRGITVCEEWHTFANFFKDMGERPQGRTLDRVDNDLGYSKANCRWATPKEQRANQRPKA